jgi:hypothetical protein
MSGTPDYTSFFNPEGISEQQYLSGGVDFYTQTLGTGIQSTVMDEEKSEEEVKEDTGPDIFKPIGGDRGPEDVGKTALENALQSGANPLDNVTLYNEGQLNPSAISFDKMGNVSTNEYSKSFETDPKTGKTTLKAKGDLVSDFFSNFTNNLQASSAQQVAGAFNMASAPTLTGPTGKPRAVAPPGFLNVGLSVVGLGFMGALASISGAANMAIQQQNAARIKAVGGGAFMDVNNAMVSRAPGSFQYSGNLMGMSQKQMRNLEAVRRGYLPGTLELEKFNQATGRWGEATGKKAMFNMTGKEMAEQGGAYNPDSGGWTSLDGSGAAMGTKEQAQSLADKVNGMFRSNVMGWTDVNSIRSTVETDIFGRPKTDNAFKDAYTKEAIDRASKTTGLTADQLNSVINEEDFVVKGTPGGPGLNDKGYGTFSDFRGSSEDAPDTRDPMSDEVQAEVAREVARQTGRDDSGDSSSSSSSPSDSPRDGGNPGGSSASGGSSSSDNASDDGSGGTAFKSGGRVGYQAGGEAGFAERPEFVGGNQTQPDKVSVADDQPRDVQEGSFVINAAAADFAGRDDIEKMLRNAYKKVGDTGQSGVSQEVQIAVSKGEVIIPPHIAKIIGYDRLNKINNRGKKEIARRQEAAGGGFIDRKKYAKGDMVLPKSKPKKTNQAALGDVELRADMEEFIQTDPLARLGWNLYEKGDLDIKAVVLPSNRKVSVGVAGVYTPKGERRDPKRISRKFEGFAEKQGVTKQNRKVAGVHYFAGENVNYGRYDATITLLHELRHHAMRHISKKYKTALPELSREESLFDAQDYANRLQARKVKPSIPKEMKEKDAEVRQRHMYMSPSANKQIAAYQSVAEEVLKDRKVPPRTKSKEVEGFFTRAMGLLGL